MSDWHMLTEVNKLTCVNRTHSEPQEKQHKQKRYDHEGVMYDHMFSCSTNQIIYMFLKISFIAPTTILASNHITKIISETLWKIMITQTTKYEEEKNISSLQK